MTGTRRGGPPARAEGPARTAREARPGRARAGRLSAREVAVYGVLAAVALVFGYVEALFPPPVPVPGVKLGLGNVVVLFALAAFGPRPGFAIMLVKVVASALLFGNPSVFVYSLSGALASFAVMWGALHARGLSLVGVSMAGGVCHMLGQDAVVALVLSPGVALAYLPVLVAAGLVAGLATGYVCRLMARTAGRSKAFRARAAAAGGAADEGLEGTGQEGTGQEGHNQKGGRA